jgi:hypothetical protein
MLGRGSRVRRVTEESRPHDPEHFHEIRLARHAGASTGLRLADEADLVVGHPAGEVLLVLGEDAAVGSERADADHAEQPIGALDEELQRQMPSPRVADRPRTVDLERVEHRNGVLDVRLDRVRRSRVRGRRPALRVPECREEVAQKFGAVAEVVGHRGATVEQKRRRAVAAPVPDEHALLDRHLERPLVHVWSRCCCCRQRWSVFDFFADFGVGGGGFGSFSASQRPASSSGSTPTLRSRSVSFSTFRRLRCLLPTAQT